MKLNDKIIDVLENKRFYIYDVHRQGNKYYVEIERFTPLGEDWIETIWFDGTDEGFIEAVKERWYNFDVDDEAAKWVECRGNNGVPSSIKALVEDAEWKKEILGVLVEELEELDL